MPTVSDEALGVEDEEGVAAFSASVLAHDGFNATFVGTEDAVYEWRNGIVRVTRIIFGILYRAVAVVAW